MVDFNTPRSKVAKKLLDAYATLDINNAEPFLSKDFHYEPVPESPDIPKQTRGVHLKTQMRVLPSLKKLEHIFHEVIETPEEVVVRVTSVLSTIFGTTINYDTTITYGFVEEDGELKVLYFKDFANPQGRSALINFAGTAKIAVERTAA